MLNQVALIGRITKNVELRKTQSGNSCVSFTLAVQRLIKNQKGEYETDFINCVAWRQTADYMGQYIKKGYLLAITGTIQTRNYQDKDGKTIYITEVVCDNVRNLTPKEDTQNANTCNYGEITDEELPF